MKTKLFLLLVFTAAVLAWSSYLFEAHADDTYNFYFQKAPGPTTVNQGGAPAAAVKPEDAAKAAADGTASPAPAANTTAQAAKPTEEEPFTQRNWELSIGYAGSKHNSSSGDDKNGYTYYSPTANRSAMVNGPQYSAAIQYNFSEHFGVQGEALYMASVSSDVRGEKRNAEGSRWDGAANLVVTPFRLKAGGAARLTFSGLIGATSVPFHKGGFQPTGGSDGTTPIIAHAGSFTYGARLGLEMGNRLALQATVRKIDRFDSTHGTASVALLF